MLLTEQEKIILLKWRSGIYDWELKTQIITVIRFNFYDVTNKNIIGFSESKENNILFTNT